MFFRWRLSLATGLVAACFWLAMPGAACAQYTVGRVEGIITDSSGAVLAGATVTLRHLGTNATRTFTTSSDGFYVFFALPPGQYQLTAEAPRFAKKGMSFAMLTSQTLTYNLSLAVGQQATTVEVVGAAGELNVADSQRSMTRTEFELDNLPVLGRNMMSVVHLSPGVVPTNNPRGGTTFGGGGPYVIILGVQSGLISANGGRARATSVQLDYTDANDWEFGGFAPGMQAITPDMLQEFKLLTSNIPAEYGVKSNAQVMMVTKSGTNEWHGTAYDYLQNDKLNARDYFDTTGRPSKLKQNVFGFTMGGPLVKDRTFFFGGYEGRRTRGGSFTNVVTLPTQAARATATDPIIIDLMDRFLPLPTDPVFNPGGSINPNVGKRTVQVPSPVDDYQVLVKLDHRFTDAHSFSARYLHSTASFVARFPSQNLLPGFDLENHFALRNVNLTDTYVMNHRTVNELRLAYGHTAAMGDSQNGLSTARFQIPGLVNFGSLESGPTSRVFNVYQVNDILSYTRGVHVLKLGADVRKIQDNSLSGTGSRGIFTFASLNDFLAARPNQWLRLFGNNQRGFRTALYGFFLQDDWKVAPTLTVNLGLRWDVQGALSEAHDVVSVLDPGTPGAIGAAGPGPLGNFRIGGPAVEANPFNLSPRIGFAWNPRNGNFVLRGGYGIYWDSFTFGPLAAARSVPPFNYTLQLNCPPLPAVCQISGPNSFDNLAGPDLGFSFAPAPILAQGNSQVGGFGSLTNFGNVTSLDPHLSNPYVQDFTLGVEYRFRKDYVVTLGYVGTKGTRLTRLVPINPIVGPGTTRLDPRFGQVNFHDDGGSSIYHSLQAELRKTFSYGLQFQASYTWSKSIDDASDFSPTFQANDNSFPQDGSNLRAERAVSNFDLPHRIVVSGIWQVPFFRHRKGLAGKLLDGWAFQSVSMWQSALPATPLSGPVSGVLDVNGDGNLIRPGLDNTRANCAPGGVQFDLGDPRLAANPGDLGFSQPALGQNGTCGRNSIRMKSLTNFDWAFLKSLQLAEHGPLSSGPWSLQLRAEMFNIFNTPFLTAQGEAWRTVGIPGPGQPRSLGQVNAAGIPRKIQFALKLLW